MNLTRDFEKPNKYGFRLKVTAKGTLQIHSVHRGAFEGPASTIYKQAIVMGVLIDDLTHAVNQLRLNFDHNYADFDSMGRFLCTGSDVKQQVV